jgi:tRNA (cytidine/uridine-2'-O-)-methyltransferase
VPELSRLSAVGVQRQRWRCCSAFTGAKWTLRPSPVRSSIRPITEPGTGPSTSRTRARSGLRGVVAYLQRHRSRCGFRRRRTSRCDLDQLARGTTGRARRSRPATVTWWWCAGSSPNDVLVNDPAQPAVAVRYPRAELDALFREHGGVGIPRRAALAHGRARSTRERDRSVRDVPLHVVLVEPQIPPNTGNVARLCAATGCALHLVEPLGFRIDDRALKRAGLDYWAALDVAIHPSLDAMLATFAPDRMWLATTRAPRSFAAATFRRGDALVFGKETAGLPQRCSTRIPSARCASRCVAARCVRSTCRRPSAVLTYAALARSVIPVWTKSRRRPASAPRSAGSRPVRRAASARSAPRASRARAEARIVAETPCASAIAPMTGENAPPSETARPSVTPDASPHPVGQILLAEHDERRLRGDEHEAGHEQQRDGQQQVAVVGERDQHGGHHRRQARSR